MKIAVPSREGQVDSHFGHCDHFTIFCIEDGKIVSKEDLPSPAGCGCKSNIAGILKEQGVTVMLAGNMGAGAIQVLGAQNINVVRGCSGNLETVVESWIAGNLQDQQIVCDHHDCPGTH